MAQNIKDSFKKVKGGILVIIVVNNHLGCVKNALSNILQALSIHSDLYLSVIVRPSPGLLSSRSIKPSLGAGSPSKI